MPLGLDISKFRGKSKVSQGISKYKQGIRQGKSADNLSIFINLLLHLNNYFEDLF